MPIFKKQLRYHMSGLFITATGTGIGKTHLTQRLLTYDGEKQRKLSASKPIISGWPTHDEEIQHTDTAILLKAQQQACHLSTIEKISPWRLIEPLTPAMAAAPENKKIVLRTVVEWCQQQLMQAKQQGKLHLIEGVGGVMAPLCEQYTVLDWIEQCQIPCLLVVGSYLGTLSHTLTAVSVLQAKGIQITAIIVNETVSSTVSLTETCQLLRSFLSPLQIIAFPLETKTHCHESIAPIYAEVLSLLPALETCK